MKKRSSKKKVLSKRQVEADIADLFTEIQEQLASLEKKVDTLVNRPSGQGREMSFRHSPRQDRERQGGGFRERTFHKVICADCDKECEVPFKPGPDRPVYCRECFAERRNSGIYLKDKHDSGPVGKFGKKKKEHKKKKPSFKKRR